jgi:hypothetical protein
MLPGSNSINLFPTYTSGKVKIALKPGRKVYKIPLFTWNRRNARGKGMIMITARWMYGVALCVALFASGCTTDPYEKGTVTATSIKNPTVGFHGYTIGTPVGYMRNVNATACASEHREFATDFINWYKHDLLNPGGERGLVDAVPFYHVTKPRAILFLSKVETGMPGTLSDYTKDEIERLSLEWQRDVMEEVDGELKRADLPGKNSFLLKGKIRAGSSVYVFHEAFCVGYLNEVFYIIGASGEPDASGIAGDVEKMARSLVIH